MSLNEDQVKEISDLLRGKISQKLQKYTRETKAMPFLAKLMQDPEKVASYSFIHSMATTLGMSIYEEVARIVASTNYDEAKTKFDVKGEISDEENSVISRILQEIKNKDRCANKKREIEEILECVPSNKREVKIRADLYLKKDEEEYFIEIKTAKPNIDVFAKSKEKLLQWVALKKKEVNTILAIPYNPYHPEPDTRFTMQGYLDEENELYVAEKFWNLLGGEGTYQEILDVFDEVGREFKEEISLKIKEVAEEKMIMD